MPDRRPPARSSEPPRREERDRRGPRDDRRPPPAAPAAVTKAGVPHGATEIGWLPDCVYTGEKFESGLAFFADTVGRLTRFSREPADLAAARRLEGQAALPGLINTHSHAFLRILRGRPYQKETEDRAIGRLGPEDVFDAARMVFMEMLLSGITCVGEFHYLHRQPDGTSYADPNVLAREVVRAAHDLGIRIALLSVVQARGGFRNAAPAPVRFVGAAADEFLRNVESLRAALEREMPPDECWLGLGIQSVAHVPAEQFKPIATYARAQRLRVHAHVSTTADENAASQAEFGRSPVALLAEHGLVDKRFTAIDAIHLSEEDVRLLGAARASVCACPSSEQALGLTPAPAEKLLAAGAGLAFGTDRQAHIDLLKDARAFDYQRRQGRDGRSIFGAQPATALLHAATVTGARSLGATSGALEVGRPADFFTVNLHDPSIAGADPDVLLSNIVFSMERRAVRDVWIGGRQRIASGRHALHGPVVGRFVDLQRRIWAA